MKFDLASKIACLFADKLPGDLRSQLLQDIASATIASVSEDNSCFIFSLAGYVRPPYEGQKTYGVDGKILDSDGEELDVMLYCDQNNRLLELEFIRWDDNPVVSPLIDTLKVY
jgi:hypothetical protein